MINKISEIINRKNKRNDSWKKLKIAYSIIPEGWTKEECFKFLQKEYSGRIMKGYTYKVY
jgi:hypothetical protein